jgi:DNA-binding transcriptional LysR family regulator
MNLETLRYLVSLADLGSLTAAAEAHCLTQPALSIRLRKLREELGAELLEMRGRRIHFTGTGEIVLEYAKRFSRLEEELLREIADREGLAKGRIEIGTIDAASAYVLPRVFSLFRERYPGIDIALEVMATLPLLRELRAGRLELVVGTLPVEKEADLEIVPIYTERLLLVARPGHRLSGGPFDPAALGEYPFISFHEGAVTRTIVERVLQRHGVSPRVTVATDSPEAIRKLAAAGLGLAILPERVVRDDIERGDLVELDAAKLAFERTLGVIIPARRYLSKTARAFLTVLAEGLSVRLPRRFLLGGGGETGDEQNDRRGNTKGKGPNDGKKSRGKAGGARSRRLRP